MSKTKVDKWKDEMIYNSKHDRMLSDESFLKMPLPRVIEIL
jgi:hypothetical protein